LLKKDKNYSSDETSSFSTSGSSELLLLSKDEFSFSHSLSTSGSSGSGTTGNFVSELSIETGPIALHISLG
jgi:hypothetical protein